MVETSTHTVKLADVQFNGMYGHFGLPRGRTRTTFIQSDGAPALGDGTQYFPWAFEPPNVTTPRGGRPTSASMPSSKWRPTPFTPSYPSRSAQAGSRATARGTPRPTSWLAPTHRPWTTTATPVVVFLGSSGGLGLRWWWPTSAPGRIRPTRPPSTSWPRHGRSDTSPRGPESSRTLIPCESRGRSLRSERIVGRSAAAVHSRRRVSENRPAGFRTSRHWRLSPWRGTDTTW
jgi:hypothetical protein